MKFISLFAGIGGFDLGFERAGMECVAQVEIDEWCQRVLTKHWPNVPKFGDINDVGTGRKYQLPSADLICGGFPCQDVSVAGWQKGIKKGTRSGLFFEAVRIIREVQPRWVVIENVTGLFSSNNGRDFATVLWELSKIGYDAEWYVISACAFGFPHTRERVFIVAYPTSTRRKGDMCQVITQKENNISLETLVTWDGIGYPLADIPQLMAESGYYRLPDGVPSTMAVRPALRSYGNAVVPQVAEFIGKLIMEIENERTKQQQSTTA